MQKFQWTALSSGSGTVSMTSGSFDIFFLRHVTRPTHTGPGEIRLTPDLKERATEGGKAVVPASSDLVFFMRIGASFTAFTAWAADHLGKEWTMTSVWFSLQSHSSGHLATLQFREGPWTCKKHQKTTFVESRVKEKGLPQGQYPLLTSHVHVPYLRIIATISAKKGMVRGCSLRQVFEGKHVQVNKSQMIPVIKTEIWWVSNQVHFSRQNLWRSLLFHTIRSAPSDALPGRTCKFP